MGPQYPALEVAPGFQFAELAERPLRRHQLSWSEIAQHTADLLPGLAVEPSIEVELNCGHPYAEVNTGKNNPTTKLFLRFERSTAWGDPTGWEVWCGGTGHAGMELLPGHTSGDLVISIHHLPPERTFVLWVNVRLGGTEEVMPRVDVTTIGTSHTFNLPPPDGLPTYQRDLSLFLGLKGYKDWEDIPPGEGLYPGNYEIYIRPRQDTATYFGFNWARLSG